MITSEPTVPLAQLADPPGPVSAPVDAALSLRGIERSLGGRRVLDGVDVSVAPGSVAWLGGPNGAGKTTLLRIAAGILLPDRGSIRLHGLDPERDRREYHRLLGYLAAGDRGLYARLTVAQNLELASRLSQVGRRERKHLLERGTARFTLEPLVGRRVDRLSMGQRQRVRLAMAFLHEPRVALLDEPHTSLDDEGLHLLEHAVIECAARGGSVLWCSPAARSLPLPGAVRYLISDGKVHPA